MAVMDDQGNFWGLVTVSDLDRAIEQNLPDETLVTVFGKRAANLQIAFPDESMGAALTRMGIRGVSRLPVVSRTNRDHLEGLIRRADIIRANNLALTKRAEIQQDKRRTLSRAPGGTEFIESTFPAGINVIGKSVIDIASCLPKECILIAINRDGKVLIPHGSSVIQEGDQITAFIRSKVIDKLHECIHGQENGEPNQTQLIGPH